MAFKQLNTSARRLYIHFSRGMSSRSHALKEIGPGGFALLTIPITTFCLGTWQIKRRTWKLSLIEEVKQQHAGAPVELPEDLEKLSDMEYRRVHVRGRFDHSKELYLGPRQLLSDVEEQGGIMSSPPKSGNLIITPFHVSSKNITILVNRGWVSRNKTDPSTRNEGQVEDEIDLIGTVRLHEKRPQFSPKTTPGSRQFYYRDVLTMAEMTGSQPIFLDAGPESTIPGGPIGGQTRITFRNEHMSYILTWYSLSAATFYIWYRKYLRGQKILI